MKKIPLQLSCIDKCFKFFSCLKDAKRKKTQKNSKNNSQGFPQIQSLIYSLE